MNVLILGSGGREHVIAWKIAQSPLLARLFIAPGNAGTRLTGTNIPINVMDFDAIRQFVMENKIDMVVVGPEDPLVGGIHDYFLDDPVLCSIPVIGPRSDGAMLEGSKEFAKRFMNRHGIPTAAHKTFHEGNITEGIDFIMGSHAPYVLKADGLAAGKGVLICPTREEAIRELTQMISERKFGDASKNVVLEEFLSGIELSMFVLTDGISYKILPEAKDYKKIGEGDTGPNTGGMGSVSPVSFATDEFIEKVDKRIIRPTIEGLQKDNISYRGFIFFGLMNVQGDPFVIEYNCRMGDPEAESVLPRIENDLLELFVAISRGKLSDENILITSRHVSTVMLVSQGYPDKYEKGKIISLPDEMKEAIIFHAGTSLDQFSGNILTSGGRVVAVTAFGNDMKDALKKSYTGAEIIRFDGKYFRRDIGFDL